MKKLLRTRYGDPSAWRPIEPWLIVFRIIISILGRIETELDRRRRGIIDCKLEILVGMGLEPEQSADAGASDQNEARDERTKASQSVLKFHGLGFSIN